MSHYKEKRLYYQQQIRNSSQFNKKQQIRLKLYKQFQEQSIFMHIQYIETRLLTKLRELQNYSVTNYNNLNQDHKQMIFEKEKIQIVEEVCFQIVQFLKSNPQVKDKIKQAIFQKIREIIVQFRMENPSLRLVQHLFNSSQAYMDLILIILEDQFLNEEAKPQFLKNIHLVDMIILFFNDKYLRKNWTCGFEICQNWKIIRKFNKIMSCWTSIDNNFDLYSVNKVKMIVSEILNQFNDIFDFRSSCIEQEVYNCFTVGDGCGFDELVHNFKSYSQQQNHSIQQKRQHLFLDKQIKQLFIFKMEFLCNFIQLLYFQDKFFKQHQVILKNLFSLAKQLLESNNFQNSDQRRKLKKFGMIFTSFMPFLNVQLSFILQVLRQQEDQNQDNQTIKINKQIELCKKTPSLNVKNKYFKNKIKLIFLHRISYSSENLLLHHIKNQFQMIKNQTPNLFSLQNVKIVNMYLTFFQNLLLNDKSNTDTIIDVIQQIKINSLYQLLKRQFVVQLSYLTVRFLDIHPSNSLYLIYKNQLLTFANRLLTFGFIMIEDKIKFKIILHLLKENIVQLDDILLFTGQGKLYQQIYKIVSRNQFDQQSQSEESLSTQIQFEQCGYQEQQQDWYYQYFNKQMEI